MGYLIIWFTVLAFFALNLLETELDYFKMVTFENIETGEHFTIRYSKNDNNNYAANTLVKRFGTLYKVTSIKVEKQAI